MRSTCNVAKVYDLNLIGEPEIIAGEFTPVGFYHFWISDVLLDRKALVTAMTKS